MHTSPTGTQIRRGALAVFLLALPWLASAAETEVFRGEYEWTVDGHRNRVEATFTPTSDGQWDVELRFAYARREGTYRGQAEGSLRQGQIRCNVEDGGGVLRYRIEAEVQGDTLEGKHYDIYSGRKKLNGTIRLERVR